MQRYIEKFIVKSTVTIFNQALPESLQYFIRVTGIVTNNVTHFFKRHIGTDNNGNGRCNGIFSVTELFLKKKRLKI
jgi:hypothetical protein